MSTAPRPRSQYINLVDAKLLKVRERLSGVVLLSVMAAGVTLVGLHYAVEKYRLQREVTAMATQSTLDEAATAPVGLPAAFLSKQEQLKREETLREALNQGGDLPGQSGALLSAVAQALPASMWLTDLQVLGAKTLVIAGGSLERPALASFAQRLEASDALKGTPIGIVQFEPRAGRNDGGDGAGASDDALQEARDDAAAAPVVTHYSFTLASRTQSQSAAPGARP
ncbi:MAG: PilN domain-containing protein [Pseudomonadota bacterium]